MLFEGPSSPFDWGVKEIRAYKNVRTVAEVKRLIDRYRPEVLVIEDTTGKHSRRSARIRKLHRMLTHLSAAEFVDLHRCSRSEVKACFASVGAVTRHEIAKAIATQIQAFVPHIPRRRRQWMSEHPRESLFNAAALGLAYFARSIPSPYTDDIAA